MIDFTPFYERSKSLQEIANDLGIDDLRAATTEMADTVDELVAACDDADVVFQPVDPAANDAAAASEEHANIAWTLGHVVVHLTAGNEEAAFLGAEMARGVPFHGRSRYETPWESITTIAQVRQRLAESRRISLAALELWPDNPDLVSTVEVWPNGPVVDARGRHIVGLMHASSHLDQIRDIVGQAQAAKAA